MKAKRILVVLALVALVAATFAAPVAAKPNVGAGPHVAVGRFSDIDEQPWAESSIAKMNALLSVFVGWGWRGWG